jgi:hypothetical protein
MIVGTHCGAQEIKLCESNRISIDDQVLPNSRWFLGSLVFITDKFIDLSLQEPKSHKVIQSGTSHLPLAPVRVGLINKEQLRHRLSELGKTDSNPMRDKADHSLAVPIATTDPIYQSSSESDFESGGVVYMMGEWKGTPRGDCRGDPAGA